MKNLLRSKNFYLIAALIVIIAVVLVVGLTMKNTPAKLPDALPSLSPTATPAPTAEGQAAPTAQVFPTATISPEEVPLGYIFVQRGTDGGWVPLPTGEDILVTISDAQDESIKNVLRLSRTGFAMDFSTCDNQDCVHQGEVTFENMNDRVLMNMVLCLPHNLSVELYTTEDIIRMMEEAQQGQ